MLREVEAVTSYRVPGHTLRNEGRLPYGTWGTVGPAVCSCGWRSDMLETAAARKRAHRAHKGDVVAREKGMLEGLETKEPDAWVIQHGLGFNSAGVTTLDSGGNRVTLTQVERDAIDRLVEPEP